LITSKGRQTRNVNTDPSSSPLAFFAAEVKRLRGIAGMTQDQLAKETIYSAASVAAIETCRLIPSKKFAEYADKAFQVEGHLARLQELVEQTSVLPWFRDLVETERSAVSIRTYESYLVPGLLQTEDYARHAVSATRPRLSEEEIQRAVTLRMTRQQILDDQDDPPKLWAIIDESVLRRETGGKDIMRAQCQHLLDAGQRPHIAIQVIPDAKGVTCAYGKDFMILTFNSTNKRSRAPVAYVEDMRSARYVREQDEVGAYSVTFDYLRSYALDDLQSADLIRGYRDERYV
jgi:transcriptional regulator with XRE-family HTH domain